MTDEIAYFRGKSVDEMTREEAIEAVKILGRLAARFMTPEHSRALALGEVEMMKRGGK